MYNWIYENHVLAKNTFLCRLHPYELLQTLIHGTTPKGPKTVLQAMKKRRPPIERDIREWRTKRLTLPRILYIILSLATKKRLSSASNFFNTIFTNQDVYILIV